jgi:chaperonin cofactor prefoldin
MAAEPTTTQPAPEGQANTQATTSAAPAPDAGEDFRAQLVEVQKQLDAVLKHKGALEADLKKHRDAKKEAEDRVAAEKAEAEKKLKEAGDFARLYDSEKEKRAALEAQLADLSPKAERLTAHEQRVKAKLDAAKAKGDLPTFIVRSIDIAAARDVDEALDILDEYRSSVASGTPAPKQPAPPAPSTGAAPPSPQPAIDLARPSVADLQRLKATDRAAHDALIFGRKPSLAQSVAARLTGVGRK